MWYKFVYLLKKLRSQRGRRVGKARRVRRADSLRKSSTLTRANQKTVLEAKPAMDHMSLSDWLSNGPIIKEGRIHSRIVSALRIIRVILLRNFKDKKPFNGFIEHLKFKGTDNVLMPSTRYEMEDFFDGMSQDLRDLQKVVKTVLFNAAEQVGSSCEDKLALLVFEQFLNEIYWPESNAQLVRNAYLIFSHPIFFNAMERYLFVHKVYQIRSHKEAEFMKMVVDDVPDDWLEPLLKDDEMKRILEFGQPRVHVMYGSKSSIALFLRNALEHFKTGTKLATMEDNIYFALPYAWSAIHFSLSSMELNGKFLKTFGTCLEQCLQDGSTSIPREKDLSFIIEYAN